MPIPFAGPATRDAIKTMLGITDALDDAELDSIAAAVNSVVRRLPIAVPTSRTVTLSVTSGSAAVTAAAGTLDPEDVGAAVTGPTSGTNPIPAAATLTAVASDVAATLSANATATASVTVTLEAGAFAARVTRGANMLGARLFRRKNSPSGVETFAGDGVVYVQRNDPDIAQLLALGDYAKPGVG